jgi:hypothetical protein
MPKPTKAALAKHEKAVVLLASPVADTSVVDHDYEWFETDKGVSEFLTEAAQWAADDVRDNADLHHMLVEITSTAFPPTLGQIVVHSPDAEYAKKWEERVKADPTLVVATAATRAPAASTKKVTPKIKPKKPSAAAAALGNGDAAKEDGGDVMAAKAAKSAQLKQRLAAKKAATEDPEVKVQKDDDAAQAEPSPKPKAKPKPAEAQKHLYTLGWAVPLGRGSSGRFTSVR